MYISDSTIQEIKDRIDIVDVIQDFVPLKKSGSNYKAISPFTDEKTPSFYVSPTKEIFKDFSSGKGGMKEYFDLEDEQYRPDAFVTKPYKMNELMEVVNRVI